MTESTWTDARIGSVLAEVGPMLDRPEASAAAFDIASHIRSVDTETTEAGLPIPNAASKRWRPSVGALAAAAVLLAIVAVLSVTQAREAVANFFGVGSTRVEITDAEADTEPKDQEVGEPKDQEVGEPKDQEVDEPKDQEVDESEGQSVADATTTSAVFTAEVTEITGAEAVALLGDLPLPQVPGRIPIVVGSPPEGGVIQSFADGSTLWARVSPGEGGLFVKQAPSAAVTFLESLGDGDALLVSGPHGLSTPGRQLAAESVVLWVEGGLELRLEGLQSDDELVELARSVSGAS